MYLIVGLGNPGQEYSETRHNVGFMMLDYLARENNVSFTDSKWKALIAKTALCDETLIMLKPQAFMNLSGAAVAQVANFYKLETDNIIVIHDDLDMELGRIKIMSGGGDGGHKGVRSVIEHLAMKNFPRIKIGIGRPSTPIAPDKYVLGKFGSDEQMFIQQKMAVVSEGINILIGQGIPAAMTQVNQKE